MNILQTLPNERRRNATNHHNTSITKPALLTQNLYFPSKLTTHHHQVPAITSQHRYPTLPHAGFKYLGMSDENNNNENPEDWEDISGESIDAQSHGGTDSRDELSYPARSPEEEDIEGGKPPQPAPETPPHVSTFPNQFPHDADHDRTKSPMTSLPNYSEPDSPTQKRGKGIVRNIMSDTWTEGAYIKPNSTTEQIIDVEKMQDR
ncbi:hypothetical protein PtrSN002B_004869 [Pyrenophora tritici-repentis]|uniref:Uncharacterized protein n=1 Tax=Pyrenophora tritici-repentis TaxID=45151 RepID=A0A317BAR3_9PLEO|nr:hypothetical protein PtrV1_01401 [Pyrenophora tritici-repentis]KAF7577229.1 hypothetical protein PtrM4_014690 [Pyrenophora tritici-repentis]KAG9387887.1 hypothetical protein A1F94_000779 [Pyrenophora tritici-repentis]KAI0579569.1 hypothetical protein Alg215_05700 [Pyrenophora tritici-repentis]KAI0611308.1 hypothetical protein TUN205_04437 [Pyrenophora tritici-repentis]